MRLTLRTLLAYLDDVLEPAQAKEIGEKISESGVAASLVNRIREVLRRRRLTAPELAGRESRLDPNFVAEYLDNTLPPESVADVERVCLESDIHLAEAAACHQILTLVLGEPVEIPPNSRERMYSLGTAANRQQQPATVESEPEEPALHSEGPVADNGKSTQRTEPVKTFSSTMPEHLRPRPIWRRSAPYVGIGALAAIWVLLLFNDPSLLPGFLGNEKPVRTASTNTPLEQPPLDLPQFEPADTATESTLPVNPFGAGSAGGGDRNEGQQANPPAFTERGTPPADLQPDASPFENGAKPSPEAASPPSGPVAEVNPPLNPNPFESQASTSTNTQTKPAESGPAEVASVISVEPGSSAVPLEAQPNAAAPAPAVPEPKLEPPKIEYASVEGVLLRFDEQETEWYLMPRRAMVYSGERIVSPEPYNSILDINNGLCRVTLVGADVGGTSVRILEPTTEAKIGLNIDQGRVLIESRSPLSQAKSDQFVVLRIRVGEELWRLELLAGSTIAGIEIEPREPTKLEQSFGKNWYTGMLFVASGTVHFDDGTGHEAEVMTGPAWLDLDPQRRMPDVAPADAVLAPPLLILPKWLNGDTRPPSSTQRRIATQFEAEFDPVQPVLLNLPAAVKNPHPRIAEYAVDCLAVTQSYAALTKALSESPHHEAREAAIRGLRRWLPESPQNAELLNQELHNNFHENDADDIYRLLWGYGEEDAKDPLTSNKLVDWLENEQIVIRELAFYHIYRLTNRHYGYLPHKPPNERRASVARWREHVKDHNGLFED